MAAWELEGVQQSVHANLPAQEVVAVEIEYAVAHAAGGGRHRCEPLRSCPSSFLVDTDGIRQDQEVEQRKDSSVFKQQAFTL